MQEVQNPKVLLVDDRPENLLALKGVLESQDLDIVLAYSGNEALAKTLEQNFCCILLDIEMPNLGGLEVAEILRGDPALQSTPIILMTAHRKGEFDIFQGYEYGAVDYLVKPIEPSVVRSKVRVFADLYRKQQTIRDLNQALVTANEDLRQFTKVAAHDLKEPARIISTYSQALEHELGPGLSETAKSHLSVLSENTRRMRSMLDDLVALLNVRDSARERELIDLSRLVNEVLADCGESLQAQRAEVVVDSLPFVHAKRAEIKVVLANLLGNAIKFRRTEELKIAISGRSSADQVVISIRDNSKGIEPRYQERIFELFQRLTPHGDPQGGTGSGLALCKAIVEKHGGKMWLESEAGEGSSFYFSIPRSGPSRPTLASPLR